MTYKGSEREKVVRRRYYVANREKLLVKLRRYYQEHKELYKQYNEIHKHEINKRRRLYYEQNKDKLKAYSKQRRERYTLKINCLKRLRNKLKFVKYLWTIANGFPSCIWCVESNIEALVGDHKNGGGAKELRDRFKGNAHSMYQYYIAHPEEARKNLQILCMKCNFLDMKERSRDK